MSLENRMNYSHSSDVSEKNPGVGVVVWQWHSFNTHQTFRFNAIFFCSLWKPLFGNNEQTKTKGAD